MSQHNIVGSEAFKRGPFVYIRSFKAGGIRRQRARTVLAFGAGAAAMLMIGGAVAAVALGG